MSEAMRRRGLTLIEMLVVISVIGLVIAITLPAVMQAMEAARRVRCASNLKMIGLAIHQHDESRGAFPGGYGRPFDASFLVQILPYVEQTALYDAINMTDLNEFSLLTNANATASIVRVSTWLCPSDATRTIEVSSAAPNYAGNSGKDSLKGEGVFVGTGVAPRDIVDGLSQTAGVSEWIVGSGDFEHGTRLGSVYQIPGGFGPVDRVEFARLCDRIVPDGAELSPFRGFKGFGWMSGRLGASLYNHSSPPNSPSCLGHPWNGIAAGSLHAGGAHVLFLDGRVQFVKQSIDLNTWYSLGTRSGGEIAAGDALD